MTQFFKPIKDEKGFTLVELIIVIAILAVIAGIAAPNLIGNINNARKKTDISNAELIANAVIQTIAENDSYAETDVASTDFVSTATGLIGDAAAKMQSVPQTKFDSGKNFKVSVTSGVVKVFDGATTSRELYPTPDSDYVD